MKLGIDFGTTRIVVSAVDRGNYPVIGFEDPEGASREWFPPLIAVRGRECRYGWHAWAVQSDPDWTLVRSVKRLLEDAGPYSIVEIGSMQVPILQLLTEMTSALKTALLECSSLPLRKSAAAEPPLLEAMIGVPANANSNQRFLTVEPFMRSGFTVLGLLNEPSAASIEYGHRNRSSNSGEQVLVYDLGGGTFDASLVSITGRDHFVVASEGVPDVGGDDFDAILSDMALEQTAESSASLTQAEQFRLHEECRFRKESLHPNTRRVNIDLKAVREDWDEVTVPAQEYYDRCRPLVERTVTATERLLAAHDTGQRLEALYVTGGGSELPLVGRMLREVFGRRVKRSAYTRSATAIGLAIQADSQAGYVLHENFTRHFGVWREWEGGRAVAFDALFEKGTPLPAPGQTALTISRRYNPTHNIGHFRYLECSHRDSFGRPSGDITIWDDIKFPFDPAAKDIDLPDAEIRRSSEAATELIEETYTCDASGVVSVKIANLTSGYGREYRLGRWHGKEESIKPGRKRKAGGA